MLVYTAPMLTQLPKPPWTKLGASLESACRKALYDFSLLEGDGPLAIALSGGKDSLTLLYLLHAIIGRGFPLRPIVALNVSGAFSCGASISQGFLQKTCQELNVPLKVLNVEQNVDTIECYSCSRQRRKALFEAARAEGAELIAFGHHQDDLSETLLLNLYHKGEFAGLLPKTPMQKYGVTIIRPLIYISEQKIWEFAKLYGFARITCQCPHGQNSKRRTVKDLLGEIEQSFPNVRSNLAQASLLHGSQKASFP